LLTAANWLNRVDVGELQPLMLISILQPANPGQIAAFELVALRNDTNSRRAQASNTALEM
jgi:hypothetical protein